MKTKRVLAVDLGASGGKCFVGTFEENGFAMEEIHRFAHEGVSFHIADRNGDLAERTFWDELFIYQNIITGLQEYVRKIANTLDSIGIDTWGSDGHFLTQDGDMLGKVYCYRDHRLDDMIEKVKARIPAERVNEITGIHFQPFNISNQLLWFATNRKELLMPGCGFLPIPTLFYYYLCGVKVVDSTWASVTQLMDAKTRQWSDELLERLEIPREVMPRIVAPGTVLGNLLGPIATSVGVNPAKLIAVGSHDTASAFASAPVEDTDDALIISSGTWSIVGKLIDQPITSDKALGANLSNEGGIGNVRLLKNCMGTWLAQELRRVWRIADGQETGWDELNKMAEQAAPFAALIEPDHPSFYNPDNMETAITELCTRTGQTPPQTRGSFLRTVYESLALKYRQVNEDICAVTGKPSKIVHIVGGGSKNLMLNQFTANALNVDLMAGPEEATAVGNIMVQALGLGIINSLSEALPVIKQAFPLKHYQPREPQLWDQAYSRFQDIQKKNS